MGHGPTLGEMITGYWTTQAVYVAAKLGISDLLQAGPQTSEQLAAETKTHAPSLFRLLRALASLGVYEQQADGRWAMTPKAEPLCSDVFGSQRALAIMSGEEHFVAAGELLYCVQTGKRGFDKLYGEPVFDWLSKHPEQAANFDQAMVSVHGRETGAMVEAYDFSTIPTVADVGGGNGSLLRGVLVRYPQVRGLLCDLPSVVERAKAAIQADGLKDRVQLVPTNFFEAVPAGANAYLLRHIIHDWADDEALQILRNIRKVVPSDGRLLIIEGIVSPGNERQFTKLLDLAMLTLPGGKERTEAEYRELLAAAGFELSRIVPTEAGVSVIEGRPV